MEIALFMYETAKDEYKVSLRSITKMSAVLRLHSSGEAVILHAGYSVRQGVMKFKNTLRS